MTDEDVLLWVLNGTPVVDGRHTDRLADPAAARTALAAAGGTGTVAEVAAVRDARDRLQAVVRGERPPGSLAPLLDGVHQYPELDDGLHWRLAAPPDRLLAVRVTLAWARLREEHPGRLRPCANAECRLFLVDHSRAGTARWCSMASCGNRMKARRHQSRHGRPPSA
ncbi:CGNR zinc finger domain-containing protein [Actinoplanes sp. NPDC049118]|uniref:CGNR zinc finger domain-containing protein n=1 Tax=Actinoplanes sp. NPDC049118 TaxID=3155769 RepID=UPI0033E83DCC